jgi:hypothetical protein
MNARQQELIAKWDRMKHMRGMYVCPNEEENAGALLSRYGPEQALAQAARFEDPEMPWSYWNRVCSILRSA